MADEEFYFKPSHVNSQEFLETKNNPGEEVNEKVKRKYVQVAKNRFTGDLGVVPLFFNRSTTSFSKKIIDKEKQAAKQKKQSLTQEMSVGDDNKDANAKESTESLNSNS